MPCREKIICGTACVVAGSIGIVRGVYAQMGYIPNTEMGPVREGALILSGAYLGKRTLTREPLRLMKPRRELPGTSFDGLLVFIDGGIELGKRIAGAGIGATGVVMAEQTGYVVGRGLAYIAAR